MEKKINLEEILDSHIGVSSGIRPAKHFYINAMLDACRQVLELAAENAEISEYEFKENWMDEQFNMRKDDLGNIIAIDRQSIINTINQVE